jgi:radical SAM-linked protein
MIRQRVRIRFRKEGDLRWISHHDLIRAFERLFRRCQLRLSMSEGFHPKPRMSFPSALSLGIAALDEVMEVELAERVEADELVRRLGESAPPGLVICEARPLAPNERKARIARVWYEIPLPADRQAAAEEAAARLWAAPSHLIAREGQASVDLRPGIESLGVEPGLVRMALALDSGAKPRDVLGALGLSDLESQGLYLTRTRVELAENEPSSEGASLGATGVSPVENHEAAYDQ